MPAFLKEKNVLTMSKLTDNCESKLKTDEQTRRNNQFEFVCLLANGFMEPPYNDSKCKRVYIYKMRFERGLQ